MPTIVQTVQGRVTGLWGTALMRGKDGKMHPLRMGDLVQRGDVILTSQDGIVRLSPEDGEPVARPAAPPAGPEIDRVITAGLTDLMPRVFATGLAPVEHACGLALLGMDLASPLRAPLAQHLLQGFRA